jgi:hypothetical protein
LDIVIPGNNIWGMAIKIDLDILLQVSDLSHTDQWLGVSIRRFPFKFNMSVEYVFLAVLYSGKNLGLFA